MWAYVAKNTFPRLRGLLLSYVYIMCARAHTSIMWVFLILFSKMYGSDLRDELQEVCWEQRIWDVFRKARPTHCHLVCQYKTFPKAKPTYFWCQNLRNSVGR